MYTDVIKTSWTSCVNSQGMRMPKKLLKKLSPFTRKKSYAKGSDRERRW